MTTLRNKTLLKFVDKNNFGYNRLYNGTFILYYFIYYFYYYQLMHIYFIKVYITTVSV